MYPTHFVVMLKLIPLEALRVKLTTLPKQKSLIQKYSVMDETC